MLSIKNLGKIYDDGTQALKDVSFDVDDGEFLIIIGLSGSGKSTLLRCINRLVEPTEGHVFWNGIDITAADSKDLREIRRKIGMVFQHFNLVKRSSVLKNVLAGRLGYTTPLLSLINKFSDTDIKRAYDVLERAGIRNQAHKRADELSGGQQQRVGISRALMQDPEIILADEPIASLDPVLAHSTLNYLEKINQEQKITVLCSLHYLDIVQRYATRVIGLRDGRVVYKGSGEDIRKMTDVEFKQIYGKDAERVHAGPEPH